MSYYEREKNYVGFNQYAGRAFNEKIEPVVWMEAFFEIISIVWKEKGWS